MADKVGDTFAGYITGVAPYGLFVALVEHYVEGRVHVSSLADDFYRFLEDHHVLRGERTGRMFRLGDQVEVCVVRVDEERRQIDLAVSDIVEALRKTGPGRRAGRAEAGSQQERRRAAKRPGRNERKAKRVAGGPSGKKRRR